MTKQQAQGMKRALEARGYTVTTETLNDTADHYLEVFLGGDLMIGGDDHTELHDLFIKGRPTPSSSRR